MDKRRRIVGKMATPVINNLRTRNVLAAVNSGPNAAPNPAAGDSACPDGVSAGGGLEFASREDVERLLNEKMKGKNKTDKVSSFCSRVGYLRSVSYSIVHLPSFPQYFLFVSLATVQAKCEQMMEYIKKLRACVKWFEDREDRYLDEQLKLQSTIESAEKQCADLGNILIFL